jgi:LysR family transcriptional regulator, glycine cleavage system transcriptional activator
VVSARLPPLNALKAFEVAGRLMSFARAAEELNVTPGAVSRQIRTLEDLLGFQLFDRNHREVALTPEAQVYANALGDSFRQMERATRRLRESRGHRALHVHCAITFTLRWLVPRLVDFHARHPRREIRLATMLPDDDELAASNHINLQIRTDAAMAALAPRLIGHRLVDIDLVPVCSPALLAAGALDGRQDELQRFTRLHSNARRHDWATWLSAAGIRDIDAESGIVFESSSLSYQAAIEGMGIAMGMYALVEQDIKAGRLVMPFSFIKRTDTGFYVVHAANAAQDEAVRDFTTWILSEVRNETGLPLPARAS